MTATQTTNGTGSTQTPPKTGKVLPNLEAENAALKAQIAAMQAAEAEKVYFKVSDKGALSVYGLMRFPVTLYRGQWETLLGRAADIRAFIAANAATLKAKPGK
jgi:hypothetical protein